MNLIGDGLVEAQLPPVLDLLRITLQKLTQVRNNVSKIKTSHSGTSI